VGGGEPARLGRKRDHSRDGVILQAALDVLAEVGYAGMTIDMVAARAKAGKATVYRRWASKEELVLEAVARTRRGELPLDELPDTGTLRGDLLALLTPLPRAEAEKRMRVMAGLASMAVTHPGFDEAVNDTMVASWAMAYRALMQRAVERSEIPDTADIETVSQVIPSVAAYRTLIRRKPFERDFLTTWIDGVVLPALHHGATPR
jgi:AcrR family transcriptional regulator